MGKVDLRPVNITICMGSSCYARGNGANLEEIEKYLEENNLEAKIELRGSRCEGNCAEGPNLSINEKTFSCVDREVLMDILTDCFAVEEVPHG